MRRFGLSCLSALFMTTSCSKAAPTQNCLKTQLAFSAVRSPQESWRASFAREIARSSLLRESSAPDAQEKPVPPIEAIAQPYREDLDLWTLPEWTASTDELLDGFKASRDERLYKDLSQPKFARRALWLYPYDACFVRAAHVAMSFERQAKLRPGKIFVFGDLHLKSAFDPNGEVFWSYHVASAFRVNGQAVVLDAAVEPTKPLPLREWLARIADDPSNTRVSICDTFSYTPLNPCTNGKRIQESSTEDHLREYLPDEWSRLVRAKLEPARLLGDEPPWLPKVAPPTDLPMAEPTQTPLAVAQCQ